MRLPVCTLRYCCKPRLSSFKANGWNIFDVVIAANSFAECCSEVVLEVRKMVVLVFAEDLSFVVLSRMSCRRDTEDNKELDNNNMALWVQE